MTTGFGFCPNCGTPRVAAEQGFCAGCGVTLSSAPLSAPVEPLAPVAPIAPPAPPAVAQPVAPPPAPPAWPVPPAPSAVAQPVAPPPWSVASPGAATPAVASAGIKITPQLLAIGGIVLAVIVGAYLFMNMNSKPGSLTFSPSTISCSSPVSFTVTARLPASLKSTDSISIWFDGKSAGSSPIGESGSDVKQQPDGSWLTVSTTTASQMQSACASGISSSGFNVATPGTHTMQIRDASGKVLAEGSYTVTP